MKKLLITAGLVLLMLIAWPCLLYSAWNVHDWVKFQRHYGDYMSWKRHGGPFKAAYVEPLTLDRHRDSMVAGLSSEEALRKKFPFLTGGDTYEGRDSYKAEYLRNARAHAPGLQVLWFNPGDGWDWCIELCDGEATVNVIKG